MGARWLTLGEQVVDQDRFDEITIAVADGQTPRTARRRLFGGSLAALLAAVGLGSADDEVAAKSCAKKCKKKNSKKARKKCKKKCEQAPNLVQTGSATLTSQSPPDCAEQGSCTDAVDGTLTGTPIAAGEFEGEFTGTNFRPGTEPNTILVDFTGTLTATETSTGDTLDVEVDLLLTQSTASTTAGDFEFDGTYVITGGTGRFAGATGDGEVSGTGNREMDGSAGTVDDFRLEGNIDFA
jgi:hypothetical protein